MGGWLSSSTAPFLLERGYFKKELLLFFFSYKECFVFFFNENEWQVPSDGLFPCLFKSLVAKTLSVIHHRSYHKEECQNRTHSSQPLCQSVDPQQTSPHHISSYPHHRLEASHPQASRIRGQGKRQLQCQPLTGHRYRSLCRAAHQNRVGSSCINCLGPQYTLFGAWVLLFIPCQGVFSVVSL